MKAIHGIESLLFSTILIANIKEAYFKEILVLENVDFTKVQFC